MSVHKGLIGKSDGGSSVKQDVTLGDYIHRKSVHDAFDYVNKEKKMTFEDWWMGGSSNIGTNPYEHNTPKYWAYMGWVKGQENK